MQSYNKYEKRGALHWDKYAAIPRYRNMVNDIIKQIVDFGPSSVLDLGCGDGLFTKKIQDQNIFIVGIDNNAKAIKIAKEKGVINAIVSKLETCDKKAECVLLFDVLEHIDDPEHIINNLGMFGNYTFILNPVPKNSTFHNKEWTDRELMQKMNKYKLLNHKIYYDKTLFLYQLI